MSISQVEMTKMIRMDVVDMIADVGVRETAETYGVDPADARTRVELIDLCVAAELNRCYA